MLAVKRALVAGRYLGYGPREEITRQFGDRMLSALKQFQKAKGLVQDGIYGINTHRKLMPLFDSYGCWLMGRAPAERVPVTVRQKIVNEGMWAYNNRAQIHYAQIRPYRDVGHRLPQTYDCSSGVTLWYKLGGGSDPSRRLFDGLGYTGTLAVHGTLVSLNQARPADLVLYGRGYPYSHVAMYVGFGRCVSMGSEGGPYLVPIDYRSDRRQIRSYLP